MASAVKLTVRSNLGRLRDQLFPYYIDQSEWVSRETLKGRHAVITFGMVIRGGMHDSFSMMGKCIVYAMPRGFLGPLTLNLAFPKGSPLRERFDQVIVRLRESGITGKIFSDRTINATDCIAPVSSMTVPSQRPLQLKDFYGMLLLFALAVTTPAAAPPGAPGVTGVGVALAVAVASGVNSTTVAYPQQHPQEHHESLL
ncbi:hypothetical protein O3P69_006213 [Scylla paramamosain]|uniref:Uncharacterized protein n=1 Tax=Scylla paramamosain TaxID=85552 RepID=A0AAW0U5S7_SCYPA